ncbi:hypothetical protein F2Y83_16255 [Bacteroides cellulosilyticus]|uniref:Uncharacterized protein n=1 Tax=Bacteroides cellulosilyticus TaxID=246787 RepID=A0A5M6A5N6_9BACE|nr:hypothetical protein F2Y86_18330 [Bacteroides cellulosilyticus]KAA5416644.1 hypothetical protein F2Y87_18195 [Bacteroides cellulosilyticus]KAA5417279.1 hypothetical protein F2Y81_13720 [Bacteroides cellulosilyticus]KAA5428254.1 hypothetical protein F2Y70_01075 [Bacteroides cellulosilyticus]KAA5433911.1 hypothetical protein F2Y83_16255 [Bacteroides cellulosilyticus]
MYLLRIKSVVSSSRGTSERRMYGASTAQIRLRYDLNIPLLQLRSCFRDQESNADGTPLPVFPADGHQLQINRSTKLRLWHHCP